MYAGRTRGSPLTPPDQDNILHGLLRAAYDEARRTGDGLDDGETNVLRKFQTASVRLGWVCSFVVKRLAWFLEWRQLSW
jgi:hypothetical protein